MNFTSAKATLLLVIISILINYGESCDLNSPCQANKDCRSGKCQTSPSHTSGSLAAVVAVCSVLMFCFGGLLCFACYKQCKDCNNSSLYAEDLDTSVDNLSIDIASIDVPDEFFRNSRIPSAEDYSGPPPYLHLFERDKKQVLARESVESLKKDLERPLPDNTKPPNYKTLFANSPPPCYNEVTMV